MQEVMDSKRRSWMVSAVLTAVVVTTMLILGGRNVGAPGVWTAVASFRPQGMYIYQSVFFLCTIFFRQGVIAHFWPRSLI